MFDFRKIGDQLKGLRSSINELDREIESLNQKRDDLAARPLGYTDVLNITHEAVDSIGAQYPEKLRRTIDQIKNKPMASHNQLLGPGGQSIALIAPTENPGVAGSIRELQVSLCYFFPDRIKESISAALDTMDLDKKAMPRAERVRKIEEIDAKVKKLRIEKDELIVIAQREGIRI